MKDFYPDVIKMEIVQQVIREELGEDACTRIINQFSKNMPYFQIEGDYENIISDLAEEDAVNVRTLTGEGGNGPFPIYIKNFGPLFWVHANEFDPIQFFKTFKDALDVAQMVYAPEIENNENHKNDDDDTRI